MAKLDPTVIYGTLNINGELTTRKNIVSSKETWFIADLETVGYTSFTTNATNGYIFDKDITSSGDIIISKSSANIVLHNTSSGDENNGRIEFTNTENQDLQIFHEIRDSLTLGSINGQSLIVKDIGNGAIAGLEVQGEIYSQGGKVWHSGNDGAGSGMDTDLFDGLQSTQFLRSDINSSSSGSIYNNKNSGESQIGVGRSDLNRYTYLYMNDATTGIYGSVANKSLIRYAYTDANTLFSDFTNIYMNNNKVWHAGNDGAGSLLDADKLDGLEGSSYLRSNALDTFLKLDATGDKYHSAGDYGINMKNSDIIACNGIWFGDVATTNEGLMFLKDGGNPAVTTDYNVLQVRGNGLGYIGSKIISTTDHIHSYLPLAGGTITGAINATLTLGEYALNVGGAGAAGIFKFTDQNSLCLHSDSACMLFSGDTPTKILVGLGYNNVASCAETAVIAADADILFFPDQQSGFNNAYRITMSAGGITSSSNMTGYSDERIKTNIKKIDSPLEKIDQISGYTFERKDLDYRKDTGVLAQEIEKILPEVIVEVKSDLVEDGKLKTVDYGKISGLLIECIKELKKEIEELKGQA